MDESQKTLNIIRIDAEAELEAVAGYTSSTPSGKFTALRVTAPRSGKLLSVQAAVRGFPSVILDFEADPTAPGEEVMIWVIPPREVFPASFGVYLGRLDARVYCGIMHADLRYFLYGPEWLSANAEAGRR
jgi:hypothetical protein